MVLGVPLRVVIILLSLLLGFFADAPGAARPAAPDEPAPSELIALTDTRAQAEELAALYDVQLYSYDGGLAVFHTQKDAEEVIALGERNGWPPLSRNDTIHLD